jgi:hypothetical protein
MTGSGVTQNTSETYRRFPGEGTSNAGSLQLTVTGGSTNRITLKQTLEDMNVGSLRSDRPYFLRAMIKGDGSQAGGDFDLRLGSRTATLPISSVTTSWQEVMIPMGTTTWMKQFNVDTFDVELDWTGGTAGNIYIDDLIFCEMDLIDGTYWVLRQNQASPTRWLLDDGIEVEDAYDVGIGQGKLQYYMWLGYGRYLPHGVTGTIVDP